MNKGVESAVNGEYWTMNQDAGTVMVITTKYSTYEFAYNWVTDSPVAPDSPDASGSGASSTGATGDSTTGMVLGLAVLVVCSAGVLLIRRRRVIAKRY